MNKNNEYIPAIKNKWTDDYFQKSNFHDLLKSAQDL